MCGIFGVSLNERTLLSPKQITSLIKDLFRLSESRGKEASGLAIVGDNQIQVLKSAVAASTMIRTSNYNDLVTQALHDSFSSNNRNAVRRFTLIGHSRLVTTGSQHSSQNNQPVMAGRIVGIHNGIVVNHDQLWDQYPQLHRQYQVDTEVIFCLLRLFYEETGSIIAAARRTFAQIHGTASIACLFEDVNAVLLATNNGSLYRCGDRQAGHLIFASERYILARLQQRHSLLKTLDCSEIKHVAANYGCLLNLDDFAVEDFQLEGQEQHVTSPAFMQTPRAIIELQEIETRKTSLTVAQKHVGLVNVQDEQTREYVEQIKRRFPHETSWQDSLRRCTRCILPATMPFIEFDADGVCNYCRHYRKLEFQGEERLEERVAPYRSHSDEPDCVVGMSGGRDSLYTLHYVKTVLKMHPVAYTYDWAMVTDLARRNISRICAKLGVEHILVSADITRKRTFIKQNVTAWLKKPALGMIPLFMAGDKQYFYYLQQVRKQLGVNLAILGENMLERTDFKTGFAGVRPYNADPHHVYTLPLSSRLGLLWYYGTQYLGNPRYINASILDTLFAAVCYYSINRNYLNLYNYIPWREERVIPTLRHEYDFEIAPDSVTTWRVGDGTAAFYNYIYYTVAGFTENETFRSHQIREGLITREDALQGVREENRPRYDTIYWYLNMIELEIDMQQVFEIIHAIPRILSQEQQG